MSGTKLAAACIVLLSATAAFLAGVGLATAPPVGQLPAGPSSAIVTARGELVAIALPHRAGGRVWRIAKAPNAAVLREVSEADVGDQVVLVFKARAKGTTSIALGLTRGERTTAYESRHYTVTVRP
jgi:hypothetical protein